LWRRPALAVWPLGAITGFPDFRMKVFTLRADPLESRRSSQSDIAEGAGGPPPRMNAARGPWHTGGRPEVLLAKKSVGGESADAWRTGAERGAAAGPDN